MPCQCQGDRDVPIEAAAADSVYFDNFQLETAPPTQPVPEPASLLLLASGLAGEALGRLRKGV
jgi:hypothetical protein